MRLRRDLVLILSLLLFGILLFFVLRGFAADGERVRVLHENTVIAEYPLSVNGKFSLLGGKNTLVIENGEAYIKDSRCPDHTCERMGRISKVRERIVCLPHRLTLKVV